MHKLFVALLGLLFSHQIFAQDFNDYKLIKSEGKVPYKFITSSTEKYKKEASENISRSEKRSIRNTKQRFYLESNFVIDELLLSGKVLFNDPVSQYVNKVLDELLKDEKELRNKVEVYVVRTDAVNAFTTNNGIIFICMGLIAQLENEAQLAYILSHELIHFQKQHSLDEFLVTSEMERGKGKYRYSSYDERLLAKSNYSKEKETESDLDGFEIYKRSKYDLETTDGVFDVLQFAHLPFDEVPFRKDFFETDDLKFPDSYFLKETKAIVLDESEDEYGTHPSVKVRRAAIANKVSEADNKGRKTFILDSKEFYKAQQICRYEIAHNYLLTREYENAIYASYLLLQENPNSVFLKKTILKALYGLTKYGNADKFNDIHTYYDDIEGSKQQVHYLFEVMNGAELNATTFNYAWKLKKEYPNDKEIAALTNDIFSGMVENFFHDIKDLPTEPKKVSQEKDSTENIVANDTIEKKKKRTKYDKIKEQIQEVEEVQEIQKPEFAKYAFIEELKDTAFVNEYKRHMAQIEIKQEKEKEKKKKKYKDKISEENEQIAKQGHALGLKRVVFVNPFYYKYNYLKKDYQLKVANEQAQKNLSEQLEESAKLVNLPATVLDKKSIKEGDVDAFNDLAILNEYISLAFDHSELDFIHPQQKAIQELATKYNTRYFCWVGVLTENDIDAVSQYYCSGCLIYPLIPYFMYRVLKGNHETSVLSLVLDAETGKMVMLRRDNYNIKDRNDLINSSLYDLCLQLKKPKRKK